MWQMRHKPVSRRKPQHTWDRISTESPAPKKPTSRQQNAHYPFKNRKRGKDKQAEVGREVALAILRPPRRIDHIIYRPGTPERERHHGRQGMRGIEHQRKK
jgi:hypothetical protein